jgi:hypothetical protein
MIDKKKHRSNRHPADSLNDGVHFDDQLKVKKEKKEGKLDNEAEKGKSNSTEKLNKNDPKNL